MFNENILSEDLPISALEYLKMLLLCHESVFVILNVDLSCNEIARVKKLALLSLLLEISQLSEGISGMCVYSS